MDVGELFVSLGIKGSDKTIGAIDGIKKGLKDTASVSLEAKAAIIGAMYALERLFSASGHAGTDLKNFNTLTGVSTQTLQQYQYAARQAGATNEEMEGTFKSLQRTMTEAAYLGKAPEGLGRVSMVLGRNITSAEVASYIKRPQDMISGILQEYAQKEPDPGLRNWALNSFGIGDGISAAMARNEFRPDVFKRAPTYNDREINNNDKANIGWSNLGTKIEMAIGHFNAAHGGQLVKDISMIADKVLNLANSFERLSEKIHLFEGIGKVFEGWKIIFDEIIKVVDSINKMKDPKKEIPQKVGEVASETKVIGLELLREGSETIFSKLGARLKEIGSSVPVEPSSPFESVIGNFDTETNERKSQSQLSQQPSFSISDLAKALGDTIGTAIGNRLGEVFFDTPGQEPKSHVPIVTIKKTDATGGVSLPARSVAPKPLPSPAAKPLQRQSTPLPPRPLGYVPQITNPTIRLVIPQSPLLPSAVKAASPGVSNAALGPRSSTPGEVNINQTMHFQHDGKDAQKTGESVKRATAQAFFQLPTLTQAT